MRNQLPSRRRVLCALLPAAGAALLALSGCGEAPGAADESAAPEGAANAAGRVVNVEVDTLAPRAFTDAIRLTRWISARARGLVRPTLATMPSRDPGRWRALWSSTH